MGSYKTTFVIKRNINGRNIYIKYDWEDDEHFLFSVKLYDGSKCWFGRFCSDFASSIDEPIEEYRQNVREAMSKISEKYILNFNILSINEAKFSWTKVFTDATEMPYGTVDLQLDEESEPKNALIDFLLNENKTLGDTIEDCQNRNNVLSDSLDEYKNELENFVALKESLESNLYGRFAQLLNEKKKRIQLLEEYIQKFE